MEIYKAQRPTSLDQIIGNAQTVQSLENMLERKTLPHTILLAGPAGCGKTTIARIIKTRLHCHDLDFHEINSGSLRGIDTMRDVQSLMNLAPIAGPCRMWLFDECHKWSNDAQNAALKMLEDTPKHVYFVLCTTDPDRLIKPILTRCCQLPVCSLSYDELTQLVKSAASKAKIKMSEQDIDAVIGSADGSARSALVLLDKIANVAEPDRLKAIEDQLADANKSIELCRALMDPKTPWKKIARILTGLTDDPESIRWAVLGYAKVVLLKEGSWQAYNVIRCFEANFYDTKTAGLVAACYDALHQKE